MIATFFGSATLDENTDQYKETYLIGQFLSEQKYTVRSGGYFGLMEAVSKGSFENNGKVDGILCASFGHCKPNKYVTNIIQTPNIFERLEWLINDSKLFVIHEGGVGTLSELFLLLDIIRKRKNNVPQIYLIGTKWYNIFSLLENEKMVRTSEVDLLNFCVNYEHFVKIFHLNKNNNIN